MEESKKQVFKRKRVKKISITQLIVLFDFPKLYLFVNFAREKISWQRQF